MSDSLLRKAWGMMLERDTVSWVELRDWLVSECSVSRSTARVLIKLFERPILESYEFKKGEPKLSFLDPLIVEFPTLTKGRCYKIVDSWRTYGEGSNVFEKAERFFD